MNTVVEFTVPENIFDLKGEEFFEWTRDAIGEMLSEVFKIQFIDSAQVLVNCKNPFDIFKYDGSVINELRSKIYFKTDNGCYILKPGIQINFNLLLNSLHSKLQEMNKLKKSTYEEEKYNRLVSNYPILKSLFDWYDNNHGINQINHSFLASFIDNIVKNLVKFPNNYRYSESVEKFAMSLYILGGKTAYQFVRINLSPALPSIQTLNKLISEDESRMNEAEFRFDLLQHYLKKIDVKFAFGSEDCTSVVRRITYDRETNSFVGFSTPLSNGIPIARYYQTDSIDELKSWFSCTERAPLLNIHMIQPLPASNCISNPSSFLLAGYGVGNTYTSIEILRRWLYIFEESLKRNIRMIGFSTDGDAKYMRAMRLASGFFASLPGFKLSEHAEAFNLNTVHRWPWFYLQSKQLFLFFQDSIHLVTKWRNRLLSSHAELRFGQQFVSVKHLYSILSDENYSKLDHALTWTDVNPKDRQNYRSCIKISSDDVLKILIDDVHAYGTYLYLLMLQMIVRAYIDQSTHIGERLKIAWCLVFTCRLWWAWIQHKNFAQSTTASSSENKNKAKFFITKTAYFSVELNAHNLLAIVLLIKERQLPQEALHIYLFNSQACESMFRNTRALSGTYLSIVNFTIADFLRRSQKLCMLNRIKCDAVFEDDDCEHLSFPVHHKQKKSDHSRTRETLNTIDQLDIENVISNAYEQALKLTEPLQLSQLLKNNNIAGLEQLSEYIFQRLNSSSKMFDYSRKSESGQEEESDLEEESDSDEIDDDHGDAIEQDGDQHGDRNDNEENYLASKRCSFNNTKIYDDVDASQKDFYFKVHVNGMVKYLHKQSASWVLTDNHVRLSNDRITRIIQTSRKSAD